MATSYKGYITPTFAMFYVHKLTRDFYAGIDVNYERYSFYADMKSASQGYRDVIDIRHKASYVFFNAKLDVGIGYRKRFHAYLKAGPGIYAGGNQIRREYDIFGSSGGTHWLDTVTTRSPQYIPGAIIHVSAGIWERIPTHGKWNILLTQEFTFVPGDMNSSGPPLRTNFISLGFGVVQKYPQVFVEY